MKWDRIKVIDHETELKRHRIKKVWNEKPNQRWNKNKLRPNSSYWLWNENSYLHLDWFCLLLTMKWVNLHLDWFCLNTTLNQESLKWNWIKVIADELRTNWDRMKETPNQESLKCNRIKVIAYEMRTNLD